MSQLVGFAEIAFDCYARTGTADFHGWRRSTRSGLASVEEANFRAVAYEYKHSNVVAIGFKGTDPKDYRDVLVADAVGIGLGLNSLAMNVQAAMDFTYRWMQRTPNVWLVGHSLGGAYVQLVGANTLKMGAGMGACGITFNAPGVLHLISQSSTSALQSAVGGLGSPVMQAMVLALAKVDLVKYFSKAAAADDDRAFAPVANFRANADPVSLLGTHVGAPMQNIQVRPARNPHSMQLIVDALGGRTYPDVGG